MASVPLSEIEQRFGHWYDKVDQEPVEITRSGTTTAFLVSADLYRDMMASYRKVARVADLDDRTIELLAEAEVETDRPYVLDDIPEVDPKASPSR
jgi:prevent-host-death family protein